MTPHLTPSPPQPTTYMLKCADSTLYIGHTNDLPARLHSHNHLKSGAKYTKARRPVQLVYQENFPTMTEARQREAALKKLPRREKLALYCDTCIISKPSAQLTKPLQYSKVAKFPSV